MSRAIIVGIEKHKDRTHVLAIANSLLDSALQHVRFDDLVPFDPKRPSDVHAVRFCIVKQTS